MCIIFVEIGIVRHAFLDLIIIICLSLALTELCFAAAFCKQEDNYPAGVFARRAGRRFEGSHSIWRLHLERLFVHRRLVQNNWNSRFLESSVSVAVKRYIHIAVL